MGDGLSGSAATVGIRALLFLQEVSMTVVEDVSFPDAVAGLVREIAAEARRLVSADTVYRIGSSEVRAAIRSKSIDKKSRGVYLRIKPTAKGATVIRGSLPKHGVKRRDLTSSSIGGIIADMAIWVAEATKTLPPIGRQGTGDRRVLPGGQFESNHGRF
jgi:hypothetical protein